MQAVIVIIGFSLTMLAVLKIYLDLRSVKKINEDVHKIVNSQRTEMQQRIEELKELLAESKLKEKKDAP